MSFAVRVPTSAELDAFVSCLDASFGIHTPTDDRSRLIRSFDNAYVLAAFDGGALIGTFATSPLSLTVPGPTVVDAVGISDIGVLPTHRRQGAMRQMMDVAFAHHRAAGDSMLLLHATDGAIYRHFGFGPATYGARYRLANPAAQFRPVQLRPTDAANKGCVRMLSVEEAHSCLPAVFADFSPQSLGEVARSAPFWEEFFELAERPGVTPRFYAGFECDGSIDGYVIYELHVGMGTSGRTVHIIEMCAITRMSYVQLFQFVCGLGAEVVTTAERPIDEPIRNALLDQRSLDIAVVRDRTWLRIIDVPHALAARNYRGPGRLAIGIDDPLCLWNNATFLIDVDRSGRATVVQTHAPAQLTCTIGGLSACYLGGTSFASLVMAGEAICADNGALQLADVLFGTARAPFCSSIF